MFTADNARNHKRYDPQKIKRVHSDEGTGLFDPGILLIGAGLILFLVSGKMKSNIQKG